jgi:hypothetical protein
MNDERTTDLSLHLWKPVTPAAFLSELHDQQLEAEDVELTMHTETIETGRWVTVFSRQRHDGDQPILLILHTEQGQGGLQQCFKNTRALALRRGGRAYAPPPPASNASSSSAIASATLSRTMASRSATCCSVSSPWP